MTLTSIFKYIRNWNYSLSACELAKQGNYPAAFAYIKKGGNINFLSKSCVEEMNIGFQAIKCKNLQALQTALVEHGLNPSLASEVEDESFGTGRFGPKIGSLKGMPLLAYAIEMDQPEAAKLLLKAGADTPSWPDTRYDCLSMAQYRGRGFEDVASMIEEKQLKERGGKVPQVITAYMR